MQEFKPEGAPIFWDLIDRHKRIFHQGAKLRRSLAGYHHLKQAQPFRLPVRGYSAASRAVIDKEVREILTDDNAEPIFSPYSS